MAGDRERPLGEEEGLRKWAASGSPQENMTCVSPQWAVVTEPRVSDYGLSKATGQQMVRPAL